MKKTHLIIIAIASTILNCLVGCTETRITQPPAASHVALDKSVEDAKGDQQKAATQVKKIVQRVTNPADKQLVIDLQSTIADLGYKLDTVTGQVKWYEVSYQTLYNHDVAQTQLAINLSEKLTKEQSKTAWWRHFALLGWGIISSLIVGVVIYFAGPWLGKILGALIKTP